jgi:hypothetical protein
VGQVDHARNEQPFFYIRVDVGDKEAVDLDKFRIRVEQQLESRVARAEIVDGDLE